ncbi:MAG: carbon storage regulator [Kiritimatiellae bacterium]|nr:carbon storage regulator [Kiritimatiellia bacterium]
MLIMTRKLGEGFRIGENIRVVVAEFSGNCVKIGVDAPREIEILRDNAKKKAAKKSEADKLREELEKTQKALAQERRRKERAVQRYARLARMSKEEERKGYDEKD